MDASRVGVVAAALMEAISEEFGDEEGVTIGEVAVVVELDFPETETRESSTQVIFRCSDPRGWVQRGLLEEARGGA